MNSRLGCPSLRKFHVAARLEYINVNIKTGGEAFYKMPFQDTSLYGKVKYLEVKPFEQLVYIQQFANQDGTPGRHPLAPDWPQSMLTSVTFTKEGTLGTRIPLEWEAPDQWTKEELATFIAGRKSMSEGWGGSFDKLEEYLQNKR
jgi:uncharacterized protein YndB with AHSA1/START domain